MQKFKNQNQAKFEKSTYVSAQYNKCYNVPVSSTSTTINSSRLQAVVVVGSRQLMWALPGFSTNVRVQLGSGRNQYGCQAHVQKMVDKVRSDDVALQWSSIYIYKLTCTGWWVNLPPLQCMKEWAHGQFMLAFILHNNGEQQPIRELQQLSCGEDVCPPWQWRTKDNMTTKQQNKMAASKLTGQQRWQDE